ncbi:c-type cytochrome [Tropicimonas marinistellae]|uniref:c-type cytochrome n=1 Tax=Tropicimonas marinistellae TaxID=1739787 RepID=UPI000834D16E|nr:cytochrome c [Tropicimonas marinistellae]
MSKAHHGNGSAERKAAALLAATTLALASVSSAAASGPAEVTFLGSPSSAESIAVGETLYAEHCAACHGENREGQPDWRRRLDTGRMPAPPQDGTGHSFTHSDAHLFAMTKLGIEAVVPGYESDMPAFEGILEDAEIIAILSFVKANWPEERRAYQASLPGMDAGRPGE